MGLHIEAKFHWLQLLTERFISLLEFQQILFAFMTVSTVAPASVTSRVMPRPIALYENLQWHER